MTSKNQYAQQHDQHQMKTDNAEPSVVRLFEIFQREFRGIKGEQIGHVVPKLEVINVWVAFDPC